MKFPLATQDRKYPSLYLVLAASFLLSLLYCPPVDGFSDDKEIYRYGGMIIQKGSVIYRDFFDHKPPLIFLINYLGLLIGGSWGLWLIDTFLTLLASYFFTRCCQQYRLNYPWLFPILFNLLLRNYQINPGLGMTRVYTAIFLVIFFSIMMGRNRYKYFWMGLLTALTFFMQQDQILPLLPFLLYALLHRFPARLWQRLLEISAGFITITALILLYFAWRHALNFFWEDAFMFNFSWYVEKKSFMQHFRDIHNGLERTGCLMAFVIALTLGIRSLVRPTRMKYLVAMTLLALVFSFSAEYLSGKLNNNAIFYYYLMPLSATIPIAAFVIFASSPEDFLRERANQGLYGFLLCCLPAYNALQHATHLSTRNKDVVKDNPAYIWLRQQSLQDYQLYIFGDNHWVYAYNQFHILAPSRWIYHHFWIWYPGWDADHKIFTSIENDLLRHKTTFILDITDHSEMSAATIENWNSFLQRCYEPVTLPQSPQPVTPVSPTPVHIWKLRSTQLLPAQ